MDDTCTEDAVGFEGSSTTLDVLDGATDTPRVEDEGAAILDPGKLGPPGPLLPQEA